MDKGEKNEMGLFVWNFRTLAEMAAATSVHVVAIIEPIIQHADWFFPDGRGSALCLSGALYLNTHLSINNTIVL